MLTQGQLLELKNRLKAQGLTDDQISAGLSRFMDQYQPTDQQPTSAMQNVPASTASQTSSTPASSQPTDQSSGGNIVSDFFKSLYNTGADYGKFVGEAFTQANRFAIDPAFRSGVIKGITGQDLTPEEAKKIISQPETTFYSPQEAEKKLGTAGDIIKTGAKATAGMEALVMPGGATGKAAIAVGALSGGLFGFSQGEDISVDNIIYGAVGGAAGSVAAPIIGKAAGMIGKGAGKVAGLAGKAAGVTEDAAAQSINKATPSMWSKALTDHGFDLNRLTSKYWQKGAGYDEMLGPIGERGNGGVFKQHLDQAEGQIKEVMSNSSSNTRVTMDDFVKELQTQKKLLAKVPGNESNIAALDEFIKGFQAKYTKGITPKQLLEIKRATDSRFGAAVANETAGSPTAQAQKMLANAAREKLKSLFPTVKEALDSQSEVLTLRPIINRARAITQTQGSQIRTGQLSNINLLNPFSWGNVGSIVLNDPKVASRLLKATEETVVGKSRPVTGSIIGRDAGMALGTSLTPQPDQQNGIIGNETQTAQDNIGNGDIYNQTNHNGSSENAYSISSDNQAVKPFGGRSKSELIQLALAQGATYKDLQEIANIYDLVIGESAQSQKLSVSAETKLQLGQSGIRALDQVEEIISKDPNKVLKAAIPGQLGARDYDSAAFRAVEALLRARSGAAVPETEVRRYMRANLPRLGDTPEDIQFKLQSFRKDLEALASSGGTYDLESLSTGK